MSYYVCKKAANSVNVAVWCGRHGTKSIAW
jgi:hypothetical protein